MTDADSAYLQMRLVYELFARDNLDSPPQAEAQNKIREREKEIQQKENNDIAEKV